MTPYYERDNVRLYLGDCRDVLPCLLANSVDLVLTDPPYFRVKSEDWDRQWRTPAEFLSWLDGVIGECARVLRTNGSLYCFASPQMAARVEVQISERLRVLNTITWRKPPFSTKAEMFKKDDLRSFFPASERAIFAEHYDADNVAKDEAGYEAHCQELHRRVFQIGPLAEGLGVTRNAIAELIVGDYKNIESARAQASNWILGKNVPNPVDFERLRSVLPIQGEYAALRREYEDLRRQYDALRLEYAAIRRPFAVTADVPYTDVWDFATVGAYPGKHPCEKPAAMLRHMIAASSRDLATVLDPFAGGGSTLDVAVSMGRSAIGIEVSEAWCERIANTAGTARRPPV